MHSRTLHQEGFIGVLYDPFGTFGDTIKGDNFDKATPQDPLTVTLQTTARDWIGPWVIGNNQSQIGGLEDFASMTDGDELNGAPGDGTPLGGILAPVFSDVWACTPPTQLPMVSFSPVSGSVVVPCSVTLSVPGYTGCSIYYTLDGSDPTTASTAYSAPISLTVPTTIKAIAVKFGCLQSEISSAAYGNTLTVLPPTFSPTGAANPTFPVSVYLSCPTPSAMIFYTQDGSTPTTGSTLYAGPITLANTNTIKAIAWKGGFYSSVVSDTFTNNNAIQNFAFVEYGLDKVSRFAIGPDREDDCILGCRLNFDEDTIIHHIEIGRCDARGKYYGYSTWWATIERPAPYKTPYYTGTGWSGSTLHANSLAVTDDGALITSTLAAPLTTFTAGAHDLLFYGCIPRDPDSWTEPSSSYFLIRFYLGDGSTWIEQISSNVNPLISTPGAVTFSPDPATFCAFPSPIKVELSNADGDDIYFVMSETLSLYPNQKYTAPLVIDRPMYINAVAYRHIKAGVVCHGHYQNSGPYTPPVPTQTDNIITSISKGGTLGRFYALAVTLNCLDPVTIAQIDAYQVGSSRGAWYDPPGVIDAGGPYGGRAVWSTETTLFPFVPPVWTGPSDPLQDLPFRPNSITVYDNSYGVIWNGEAGDIMTINRSTVTLTLLLGVWNFPIPVTPIYDGDIYLCITTTDGRKFYSKTA